MTPLKVLCVPTEVPQQREVKSHQPLQPATVKAVRLSEELKAKPPTQTTDKYYTHKDTDGPPAY